MKEVTKVSSNKVIDEDNGVCLTPLLKRQKYCSTSSYQR